MGSLLVVVFDAGNTEAFAGLDVLERQLCHELGGKFCVASHLLNLAPQPIRIDNICLRFVNLNPFFPNWLTP